MKEFCEKTVLITGAASGIGLLSAKCFAEQGAKVSMVDLHENALQKAAEELKGFGGEVICHVCDVRDFEQVTKACKETVSAFGSLDVLVCCAGGSATRILDMPGEFYEQPIEVLDFDIDVNLKGALYFNKLAMGQMIRQKRGVIINLGSISGLEGTGHIGYSAAKSALMNGVVKSLAIIGGEHGVRACCVAPGPVMTRPGMAGMKTLIGRAAEPQEIVDMILYLASEKAASITGTTILIDGGRNVLYNKG